MDNLSDEEYLNNNFSLVEHSSGIVDIRYKGQDIISLKNYHTLQKIFPVLSAIRGIKDKRESYKFYQNHSCQFFPCHDDFSEEEFSCLFCYCPLYHMNNCGGDYTILNNNIKDCSECKLPHKEENYEYIIKKLMEENNGSKQRKS